MPCTALSEKDPEDKQKMKSDGTDLAAYGYEGGTPTGAEIESASEVQSHPTHVMYDMTKWAKTDFVECHMVQEPRDKGARNGSARSRKNACP